MTVVQITADNVNPPEAVTPAIWCTSIIIVEADGLASTDFLIRCPLSTSPAVRVSAGQQFRLQTDPGRSYSPNEVAFYLETITGTINFAVIYA